MGAIKTFSKLAIVLMASLVLMHFSACQSDSSSTTKGDGKLQIVATTGMIKDAVDNVVKDKASVTALMGTGVDPHYYKATQNDLTKLTDADVVFYNGLFLEGKMGEILEKMGRKKPVLAVSDDIDRSRLRTLIEDEKSDEEAAGKYDPHIWFDVELWMETVKYISQKLQEQDKKNAEFYKKNGDSYLQELSNLHNSIKTQIGNIPDGQRTLITSHDAFGYFGQAYDIEVRGLQGISTVTEFGLKDISNMVNTLVKDGIKAVFVESAVSSKPLEAVVEGCKKRNHEVKIGGSLFADAMGADGTPEGTYIGMIQSNVNTITEALK